MKQIANYLISFVIVGTAVAAFAQTAQEVNAQT